MSLSICTCCLSRLRLSSRSVTVLNAIPSTPLFHSSASQHAQVAKKKTAFTGLVFKHREARSAKIKKKTKERPKPPAVGERKAARKRVVLSNTNALDVPGMVDLTVKNMADALNVGKVLGLEGRLLDQLREAKAFKTTQNWNVFRKPATLIREETASLGQEFGDINDSTEDQGMGPRTIRRIISGERSSGKSLLLLQAMSMAFLNRWIVINVPEAQDFVNNQSSYGPAPVSDGHEMQYIQPQLASAILSRIVYANGDVLNSLKVSQDHSRLKLDLGPSMTLRDLAMIGAEEVPNAWAAWQALWKEVTEPSNQRVPPVLITIDGLDHWMCPSKYRSSSYEILHAHQFLLIKQLLDVLFSTTSLANGGMVLGATTASNSPNTPTFEVLMQQLQARASGMSITDPSFPMPEPYSKPDHRVLDLLNGSDETDVQNLTGLSKIEAKGLLEYFARSGVLREQVTDAVVGEKWSLSGGGVIGEMAKFGTRLRL